MIESKNIHSYGLIAAIASIILTVCLFFSTAATSESNSAKQENELFEQAVRIIKKYEGMHSSRHWPFVGYGHKVLPGENYKKGVTLTEKEADALVRKDLKKLVNIFADQKENALLLATLAYNIGPGNVKKSTVYKKLKAGNKDIRANYISHAKYKGKTLSQLKRRRIEEFNTLFKK